MRQTTVAFRTLGCKLNQCETAQMQEILTGSGYAVVDWDARADIRVINTCTVTAKSDRTCRREIRLAKRLDPDCLVAVTGCYAQVDPEAVAAIPGVDLVLGNIEKLAVARHLAEVAAGGTACDAAAGRGNGGEGGNAREGDGDGAAADPGGIAAPDTEGGADPDHGGDGGPVVPTVVSTYPRSPAFDQEFISHFYGYTRAFLKIQTGCDCRCAYCIIPIARGPARSMPQDQVLEQVRLLSERGYKEIVLTGINLGSWGRDTGEGPLASLVAALTAVPQAGAPVPRLRLSSIEPLEVGPDLLAAVARGGDAVAHHFHLPLQSGSAAVLRHMNRPYQPEEYLEIVTDLAARFPDAALGADVIVGFPGETDEQFEETLAFVEASPLTYLHVFSYSDRPGTAASAMSPKVHPDVIHERSVRLRASGERKNNAFAGRLTGTEQRALVLRERDADGRLVGLTGNYMEVLLPGDDSLMNQFVLARLERRREDGRWEVSAFTSEQED